MRHGLQSPNGRRGAACAAVMALGGLTSPAGAAECRSVDLPTFDAPARGGAGWAHVPLSKLKRDTVYKVERQDGQPVLHATAQGSASAYVHMGRIDITPTPMLEWRWRVPALIAKAANEDPKREDAPARLIFAFDGDKTSLPEKEQSGMARAKRLSGRTMPYAMLMYIWDNRNPVDMIITSAHSTRVKMIVAESGPQGVGAWRSYRRNLAQDFERAFGEKPQGMLGVAVMTDTDNTGETTEGFYGAIRLACAGTK